MCGIVGLFLKDKSLEPELGNMLTSMLITMTDRGPDSAGIAIYGNETKGSSKMTVQSDAPELEFAGLESALSDALGGKVSMEVISTHAVLSIPAGSFEKARAALSEIRPNVRVMSRGDTLEIYKEVGLPKDVAEQFNVTSMSGTHGIGHTRMATESAITTMGAHPFNTGDDQCLGAQRIALESQFFAPQTAPLKAFISKPKTTLKWARPTSHGRCEKARRSVKRLRIPSMIWTGSLPFLVGTKDGFGVVRDPIACKPAVMAETDQYVAFGSEYRALVNLPGIEGGSRLGARTRNRLFLEPQRGPEQRREGSVNANSRFTAKWVCAA